MPGGDRTGPLGMGPMTGRAAGYCAGYSNPGFTNPVFGRGVRGFGRGFFGRGRGNRHMYYATGLPFWARYGAIAPDIPQMAPEQEMDLLSSQADYLKKALEDITKRIDDLEKKNKK